MSGRVADEVAVAAQNCVARIRKAVDGSGVDSDGLRADIAANVLRFSSRYEDVWMAAVLPQAIAHTYESLGAKGAMSAGFVFSHTAAVMGFMGDDLPAWLEMTHMPSYETGIAIRVMVDAMLEDES